MYIYKLTVEKTLILVSKKLVQDLKPPEMKLDFVFDSLGKGKAVRSCILLMLRCPRWRCWSSWLCFPVHLIMTSYIQVDRSKMTIFLRENSCVAVIIQKQCFFMNLKGRCLHVVNRLTCRWTRLCDSLPFYVYSCRTYRLDVNLFCMRWTDKSLVISHLKNPCYFWNIHVSVSQRNSFFASEENVSHFSWQLQQLKPVRGSFWRYTA